ncbi:MAG: hypothetical protein IPH35_02020 [Rhodoferax sp.]|nr:hypothetical protein [Rhodoferax sp.]
MYIDASTVRNGEKSYTRYLLRESFRDGGKVKHRTIANLSKCSEQDIAAMRLAFKHKDQLSTLSAQLDGPISVPKVPQLDTPIAEAKTAVVSDIDLMHVQLHQGQSIGAIWLLAELARELGITSALGSERAGRLALWQVLARAQTKAHGCLRCAWHAFTHAEFWICHVLMKTICTKTLVGSPSNRSSLRKRFYTLSSKQLQRTASHTERT